MQEAAYSRRERRLYAHESVEVVVAQPGLRAVAYYRVSTDEQARFGQSLDAQRHAVGTACERRGWTIVEEISDEGLSGKSLERAGLTRALEMLADDEADALVVSKLDRLSRSVIDFGLLVEWFARADAVLLALDLDVDTSSPGGRLVANVFASVAEWERETISARTKDGLANLRRHNKPTGPPSTADHPELQQRIRDMRERGFTLQQIADHLNTEGVPTLRGGKCWRVSSVQSAAGYKRRPALRKHKALPDLGSRRRSKS